MKVRSKSAALCGLLLSLPLMALVSLLGCPRRASVDPEMTPMGLHAELLHRGLAYEAHEVLPGAGPDSGVYLKRPGDARPWSELAGYTRLVTGTWKGFLLVREAKTEPLPVVEGERCAAVGPLVIYGDPTEIRRVVEALR